ncbi:hypothetical protein QYM36_015072 [Artemia franciscana]|uniref:Uncharacterized protein n=1 Tax=Artemia franciscana TaxID=6661 RepID=A0AA88KZB2_ARTSF|nr:hypothetical protein QYM36_015072 [Artemia franciscana]
MKTEVQSYQQIAQAISTLPERILFLTDIPAGRQSVSNATFFPDNLDSWFLRPLGISIFPIVTWIVKTGIMVRKADAASSAGFQVRLVSRPGNNPVSKEDKERHNIIHSFEELLVANTD